MLFIETPTFTNLLIDLLDDDSYAKLQEALILNPDLEDLIQGSGRLRKIRWGLSGKGKRGGVRVIYYWKTKKEQIILLLIYPKNVQDNLTNKQLKILKHIVEEELNDGKKIICTIN